MSWSVHLNHDQTEYFIINSEEPEFMICIDASHEQNAIAIAMTLERESASVRLSDKNTIKALLKEECS